MKITKDTIYLDSRSELLSIPINDFMVQGDEKWRKHIYCDGARFHVISGGLRYDGTIVKWCSEDKCVMNKIHEDA